MASAKKVNKKIIKEISTFELSLSKEEAEALHDLIFAGVAGDPLRSRRKYIASIRAALTKAGVRDRDSRTNDIKGVVTFE